MQMRSVPRNIDRPNRTPEYVMTYLTTYYACMFVSGKALPSILLGAMAAYFMYKLTMDKPEGLAMRVMYRYIQLGRMRPSPRFCKKLEM
ncbi:MAG: hypothetical protein GC129_01525 [Proteobacteria bacterium]|nr:hypothetical protein [Pseudomonadota bacterium]